MKKLAIFALTIAAMVSLSSCHKILEKVKESKGSDIETVYIEAEEYDGPSDVDILDIPITSTEQTEIILDEIEYNINCLRDLMNAKSPNQRKIDKVSDRINALSQKVDPEYCTYEQSMRIYDLSSQLEALYED